MPALDDPIEKALRRYAQRLGLPDSSVERILQYAEAAKHTRRRQLYHNRRATGWRRKLTRAQKDRAALLKRKKRATARTTSNKLPSAAFTSQKDRHK